MQSPILDVVVTRRDDDPTCYRTAVKHPQCRLIEVPFVPEGMQKCRRDLAIHGDAPFVAWFDPDDELYPRTIHTLISYIKAYPHVSGVLMTSDIYHPASTMKTIQLDRFAHEAVHSHLMRAVNRKWLNEHLDDFNWPIAEWVFTAKLIQSDAIILPIPAYKWIGVGAGGTHLTHGKNDILITRAEVQRIMGDKYDYNARVKQPHGK